MHAMGWKAYAVAVASLIAVSAMAAADAPTREIVEKVLKQKWDRAKSTSTPRSEVTLNEVRFGKPYAATAQ